MTDQTVDALQRIQKFAEENGAVVDRVEVELREMGGKMFVAFTADLSPRPLAQSKACIGYECGVVAAPARTYIIGENPPEEPAVLFRRK